MHRKHKKNQRIPSVTPSEGKKFSPQAPTNYNERPPIFSLQQLQDGKYCLTKLDKAHKASFSESIFKRRKILWKDLQVMDRHGLGTEKIAANSLHAPIPGFAQDNDYFLAFRYKGVNSMVGYRVNDIFFVMWFDHDFTLYKH